ncbi:MAG: SH3 domain-containing protein [Proteobacteria bacterium]|nr:SH3 domain-containing protein [Pseudomonadota bacterium]
MHAPRLAVLSASACLLLSALPGHAQNAQLIRQEALRAQPSVIAQNIMEVARRSEVRMLESRHGWTRIEAAGGRTGWVPDTSLDRNPNPPPASAQLPFPPSAAGRTPSAQPRASRHALILTAGTLSSTPASSAADAGLGTAIARLSGVPDANIRHRSNADLGMEGLRQSLAELDARMGDGDQALIYLSATGIHRQERGRCVEAILTQGGEAFTLDEMARHLRQLAARADKVYLILDAGRGDGSVGSAAISSRFAPQFSDPSCKTAPPAAEFSRLPPNILVLTASRPNENAGDTPAGGLFSTVLHACLSGNPAPDSPSGLPTGEALATCSRQLIATSAGTQHPGLAGNDELVLALPSVAKPAHDARLVLRAIHAQRDQRRHIELALLSAATPGMHRLRVTSSTPGYIYVLSAAPGSRDFRLLYPTPDGQQAPLPRTAELEIPLSGETRQDTEWLVLVSDAARHPRRAGFTSDGPHGRLPADGAGVVGLIHEFLSGDGSRTCLFSETRNLGPTQALTCSSRFGAALLGAPHPK